MIDKSAWLLEQFRSGDDDAAREILDQYSDRLVVLARQRMSKQLQRKLDPEDVVQSALRSFFGRVRDGRLEVDEPDRLWGLLARITVVKVLMKARQFSTQKKSMHREIEFVDNGEQRLEASFEPTPDEAVALNEEFESLCEELGDSERSMLVLHLEGFSIDEIASQVERSPRTVRRFLKLLRDRLEARLQHVGASLAEEG